MNKYGFIFSSVKKICQATGLSEEEYKHKLLSAAKRTGTSLSGITHQEWVAIYACLVNDLKSLGPTEAPADKSVVKTQPTDSALERNASDVMRKKLISIAYQLGWSKGGDWRLAISSIDSFCMSDKGIHKFPIQKMNSKQLSEVVAQFEKILKSHFIAVGKGSRQMPK